MTSRSHPGPVDRPPPGLPLGPSYHWALKPGWVLSHLFVLACVVVFVRLGIWQLTRLDERRTHNALVAARQHEPAVPVGDLLAAGAPPEAVGEVEHRHVSATGIWRTDEQVLIRNETYGGAPGMWVVTPLALADGRAVAVNRGWVPATAAGGDSSAYAPPAGTVTVTGVVSRAEQRDGLGPVDPAEGRLRDLARVDVGRIARQVDEPLLPAYVTMREQHPAGGELPLVVPPPELDDGPHLNYAGQWFIFATLTCIVYPLLLRRTARHRAGADAGGADAPDGAAGDDGSRTPRAATPAQSRR